VRYDAFVAALADEERAAAEIERLLNVAAAGCWRKRLDARNSGVGVSWG
jgi:hypothetical protein